MAPCGQRVRQVWHLVQRSAQYISSGRRCWPSGLWHQRQRRGQPLKKTVVRKPGPSWTENLRISNTMPVAELSKRSRPQRPARHVRPPVLPVRANYTRFGKGRRVTKITCDPCSVVSFEFSVGERPVCGAG